MTEAGAAFEDDGGGVGESNVLTPKTIRHASRPERGPAAPMSKRARRFGNLCRMTIKAPSVPTNGLRIGAGRKKGHVQSTR
jgi:hypothetical protein